MRESITYRPEIDGLRAVAVLPVVLFHMEPDWMPGGYIGVDVFFVISGFLICSILKKELETGTFSFRKFWARRIRRVLPMMVLVSGLIMLVTSRYVFRPDIPVVASQSVAALLSVANIYFARTAGDYWGPEAEESAFLHTWSLSVEEQFYLFIPVMFWLLYRPRTSGPGESGSAEWLPRAVVTVGTGSLCLFVVGLATYPVGTFYLLPTRAWELAAGAYLALLLGNDDKPRPDGAGLALAGLCMIGISFLFMPEIDEGLVIPVLGTALVLAYGHSGVSHKMLAWPPLVHVGKLSYSIYLWHWPALLLAKNLGYDKHRIALAVLVYLASLASYLLVEMPTRRHASVRAIGLCYLAVLGFSVALLNIPSTYDTSGFAKAHWYGLYYDVNPRPTVTLPWVQLMSTVDVPAAEISGDAFKKGGIIVGEGDGSPEVVVLGDSHGAMWSDAIRTVVEKLGVKTAFISMNNVSPFVTLPIRRNQSSILSAADKYDYDTSRLELIERWKPRLVIVCSRWDAVTENMSADLLSFLEQHSEKVLLMEQPPMLEGIADRNALQFLVWQGVTPPKEGTRKYFPTGKTEKLNKGRELIRKLVESHPNFGLIPIYPVYGSGSEALVLDGNNIVYLDDDHLTTYGARLALPIIERALTEALGKTPSSPQP